MFYLEQKNTEPIELVQYSCLFTTNDGETYRSYPEYNYLNVKELIRDAGSYLASEIMEEEYISTLVDDKRIYFPCTSIKSFKFQALKERLCYPKKKIEIRGFYTDEELENFFEPI